MKSKKQITIMMLVKTREDFQSIRKSVDNRVGFKADGTEQNVNLAEISKIVVNDQISNSNSCSLFFCHNALLV